MHRNWRLVLRKRIKPGAAVIGIGHRFRADDALGPAVLDMLRGKAAAPLFCCESVPEKWFGPIRRAGSSPLVVVDAADFLGEPGEIRVLETEEIPEVMYSTHAPSPATFMRLLREETGADVFMLAVQPASLRLGEQMSEPVKNAAEEIAKTLLELLPAPGGPD